MEIKVGLFSATAGTLGHFFVLLSLQESVREFMVFESVAVDSAAATTTTTTTTTAIIIVAAAILSPPPRRRLLCC